MVTVRSIGAGVGVGVAVGGKGVGVQADAVMVAICSGEGPQAASEARIINPPIKAYVYFIFHSFGK